MNLLNNEQIPGKENAVCFWSWNGKIEEEEVRRQIREFADGRFSGVVIHSRAGLSIPYMGEEWFNCYRVAIEEAERLGLEVWIYDEDGWPSGFAGGKVTALGEDYLIKCLEFSYDESGYTDNFVAAWSEENGKYKEIQNGEAKKGDLVCRYTVDSNYVDLLSAKTVRAFIDSTHEVYKAHFGKYFGNVIKGIFTDEPQLSKYAWSSSLETYWREKYGEDLKSELYKLILPADDCKSFRLRFRKATSELFHRSYTKQISEWCEENGLVLSGHFGCEDGLFTQVPSNAGVMRQYVDMQFPGIDHLGRRNTSPVLEKQASSIADQFDKPEVLSETFGCAGWDLSFKDIEEIWGRQSALGVTLPCFHLSAYSITGRRKRDYPAFFSEQEPYWEQFAEIMRWVNNLNRLMKEGKREVDVLVISPLDTVSAEFTGNNENYTAEYYSAQYRLLLENLLDLQLDFEIGDETVMEEYASVTPDAALKVGSSSYRTVIVSSCETLRPSTVKLLEQFAALGGRLVYIGAKPEFSDYALCTLPDGCTVQNRRDTVEKWIEREKVYRPVTLRSAEDNSLLHGALIHTRDIRDGKRIHIWTGNEFRSGETVVSVASDGKYEYIYRINLQNGSKQRLKTDAAGDMLFVNLKLNGGSNIVLELSDKCEGETAESKPVYERHITDCEVLMTDKNALNIDYASISIENGGFSMSLPAVHQLESIYKQLEAMPGDTRRTVRVRYAFNCDAGLITYGLSLVFEDEKVKKVFVNGKELELCRTGFWIDKGFGEYSLKGMLKDGKNEVELVYEIAPAQLLKSGFETERNRFFYPVEPESIYIRGDFDVKPFGKIQMNVNYYSVENAGFVLTGSSGKKIGYLAEQGAPFYNGNLSYRFKIDVADKSLRYCIATERQRAVAAVVKIGDFKRVLLSPDDEADITDALKQGENEICVTLLGHNRNLLGPHHHKNGVTAMVGPSTFAGVNGFEDFVNYGITPSDTSTWTDSYSFVPFGCEGFKITAYKC